MAEWWWVLDHGGSRRSSPGFYPAVSSILGTCSDHARVRQTDIIFEKKNLLLHPGCDWSQIEGHEPLDLSNVVGKGTTKIRFTQTRDHSQYLFVLRAHRPTKAQLDEFDRTSLTGQMWTRTLARVAAPLPADLTGGILLS